MLTSPYFRRIFLPYLALIVAAIGAVGLVGVQRVRSAFEERTHQDLSHASVLVARLVAEDVGAHRDAAVQAQVSDVGRVLGCRITIIRGDGKVIADNEADPVHMDNHRLRPEVVVAAEQGEGRSIRPSDTVHQDMFYFARRVGQGDGLYYVRLSVHMTDLVGHIRVFYTGLAVASLASMAVAGAICFHFARRHTAPLVELTDFAQTLARGELSRRFLTAERGEIGDLASALNAMAESLRSLLIQVEKDRAELLTILLSMSDGVIATDARQRVRLVNKAAANLLGFVSTQVENKMLWEVVQHEQVLKAAEEVLASGAGKTFELEPGTGRHLSITVRTYPLAPPPLGLVIVAHDTTQAVRFQDLRKEFVANVSHELRTPLTAIKGYAETLRDGAMKDAARAAQYLQIIEKHADQLTNLVGDLLELSKLENAPGLPRPAAVDLAATLRHAAEIVESAARKKEHTLTVKMQPGLPTVVGDADYLERAVANLLDNAIKYTPAGGKIGLTLRSEGPLAVVEVTDNGIGIPAEDQPRIFERFYRVDRSRSREMGGTGLGLSIVKHVVQAHRGSVELTSAPGQGSTFRLKIPFTPPVA